MRGRRFYSGSEQFAIRVAICEANLIRAGSLVGPFYYGLCGPTTQHHTKSKDFVLKVPNEASCVTFGQLKWAQ